MFDMASILLYHAFKATTQAGNR